MLRFTIKVLIVFILDRNRKSTSLFLCNLSNEILFIIFDKENPFPLLIIEC